MTTLEGAPAPGDAPPAGAVTTHALTYCTLCGRPEAVANGEQSAGAHVSQTRPTWCYAKLMPSSSDAAIDCAGAQGKSGVCLPEAPGDAQAAADHAELAAFERAAFDPRAELCKPVLYLDRARGLVNALNVRLTATERQEHIATTARYMSCAVEDVLVRLGLVKR